MLVGSVDSVPPPPATASEGVAVPVTGSQGTAQSPAIVQASANANASNAAPPSETVRQAVSQANDVLRSISQAVEFQYDSEAHVTVIRLVDTQDQSVLRQIPSPEMLEIAKALERMQTMLVRDKA